MGGDPLSLDRAVDRAKCGEATAFSAIYDEFSPRLHTYAYHLLGNRQDAEDVIQETFLKALQSLHQLRDSDRLESWLYAIASHRCLDLLRRRSRIWWIPLSRRPREIRAEDHIEGTDEADLVQQALRRLPPKDAMCLSLRHTDGFSCSEIAEIMRTSPTAIWSRLSRARAKFIEAYDSLKEKA
ncbi:MAG: RNA polymerase sigma factor [Dehalococcoidia bacterium]